MPIRIIRHDKQSEVIKYDNYSTVDRVLENDSQACYTGRLDDSRSICGSV